MSHIELKADASAFELVLKLAKIAQLLLDVRHFPEQIIRAETVYGATGTGIATVHLYPSDEFLRFLATAFAGNFDFGSVE